MPDDALVNEQMEYYAARAPEYDDWWERRGEFDTGASFAVAWREDVESLHEWLAGQEVHGTVLEIAAGTGNWTGELVRYADRVVALDSSAETLEINRAKNGGERIEFLVADVFSWEPTERFGFVFCGFWLSHVPEDRWEDFWALVSRAVEPDGKVLFVDNAHPQHSALGPRDGSLTNPHHDLTPSDRPNWLQRRAIADGSTFQVVKRYWWPTELEEGLARVGFSARVGMTSFAFMHGVATPGR